jgi:hypothetical protein
MLQSILPVLRLTAERSASPSSNGGKKRGEEGQERKGAEGLDGVEWNGR